MATIKNRTPGPNIGTVGSGKGHPKSIGMQGNVTGSASSKGGQHPFLPAPKVSNSASKPGQVSSGRVDTGYSFLPKKAGGK